jgi:hypothetical protein
MTCVNLHPVEFLISASPKKIMSEQNLSLKKKAEKAIEKEQNSDQFPAT